MIVLYIFLGILVFLLLLLAMILFIPFKIYIKGTYWEKEPTGQMDAYWIKYFLGSRIRIRDLEHIHILVWFLGLPIPLKFPLKKEDIDKSESMSEEKPQEKEQAQDPVKINQKASEENKSISDKIHDLIAAKDSVQELWGKYSDYVKKIFVSYITFSIDYIETKIGLKDPSQTGMLAGIVYSALSIRPSDNIRVSWDYAKPNFNISSGIKMTMNLYGILRTLLSLYRRYKKESKNEIQ